MSGKLPFMQFYPSAWFTDTRLLSAEARGAWIDLLCHLWNQDPRGVWTGSVGQFARVCGIEFTRIQAVLDELRHVANIEYSDAANPAIVTVMSRRIVREEKEREHARIRKARERGHASVTDMSRQSHAVEVRSSEVINVNNTPLIPPKGGGVPEPSVSPGGNGVTHPLPPPAGLGAVCWESRFQDIWTHYPRALGKKAAQRHFLAQVKTEEKWQAINQALENFKAAMIAEKRPPDKIAYGSTWFNGNWEEWVDRKTEAVEAAGIPSWK